MGETKNRKTIEVKLELDKGGIYNSSLSFSKELGNGNTIYKNIFFITSKGEGESIIDEKKMKSPTEIVRDKVSKIIEDSPQIDGRDLAKRIEEFLKESNLNISDKDHSYQDLAPSFLVGRVAEESKNYLLEAFSTDEPEILLFRKDEIKKLSPLEKGKDMFLNTYRFYLKKNDIVLFSSGRLFPLLTEGTLGFNKEYKKIFKILSKNKSGDAANKIKEKTKRYDLSLYVIKYEDVEKKKKTARMKIKAAVGGAIALLSLIAGYTISSLYNSKAEQYASKNASKNEKTQAETVLNNNSNYNSHTNPSANLNIYSILKNSERNMLEEIIGNFNKNAGFSFNEYKMPLEPKDDLELKDNLKQESQKNKEIKQNEEINKGETDKEGAKATKKAGSDKSGNKLNKELNKVPVLLDQPLLDRQKEAIKEGKEGKESEKYESISYPTYIVDRGDRLWDIVIKRYGLKNDAEIAKKVNEVVELNKDRYPEIEKDLVFVVDGNVMRGKDGIKGDYLKPGWEIRLPSKDNNNSADENGSKGALNNNYRDYSPEKSKKKLAKLTDPGLDDLIALYSKATYTNFFNAKRDMKKFNRHIIEIADYYSMNGAEKTLDMYAMLDDNPNVLRKVLDYSWHVLRHERKAKVNALSLLELNIIKDAYYSNTNNDALKEIYNRLGIKMSTKTMYNALDKLAEINGLREKYRKSDEGKARKAA